MENLKRILRQRKMTQVDLAVAARISPFRLSRLLHGRARLRAADRRQIAHALGIPRDELFPRRTRHKVRRSS